MDAAAQIVKVVALRLAYRARVEMRVLEDARAALLADRHDRICLPILASEADVHLGREGVVPPLAADCRLARARCLRVPEAEAPVHVGAFHLRTEEPTRRKVVAVAAVVGIVAA